VTQLFAILFFASVLGVAVAILWSVVDENRDLVLANMPWSKRLPPAPPVTVRRAPALLLYWAMPSISSDKPARATTVSPATVL